MPFISSTKLKSNSVTFRPVIQLFFFVPTESLQMVLPTLPNAHTISLPCKETEEIPHNNSQQSTCFL